MNLWCHLEVGSGAVHFCTHPSWRGGGGSQVHWKSRYLGINGPILQASLSSALDGPECHPTNGVVVAKWPDTREIQP